MQPLEFFGSTELWLLAGLCFLGTFVWRAIGAAVAAHIDPDGIVFQWLNCVAYAMLAGLIARILLLPIGILASTPTLDRAIAMAAGFALFFALRRHVFIATLTAFAVMLALSLARAHGLLG